MNILFIDREVSASGASNVTVNAARTLSGKGHMVTILALLKRKEHADLGAVAVITPLDFFNKILQTNSFFLAFIAPFFLFFLVLKHAKQADILMPTSHPTHWLAVLASTVWHKPVIWSCYEPFISVRWKEIKHVGFVTWFSNIIAQLPFDRYLVKRIDVIIVLDKKNQYRVKQLYKRNVVLLRSGVDYDFFSSGESETGQKLWKTEGKFVVTCAGILAPMKNQEILLEAIYLLKTTISDILLLLSGEGPMRKYLEKKAKKLGITEHVRFLGHIATEELPHLYASTDIILFPAIRQTWGLTVFEAGCAGIPAIVSNDCGAAEIIEEQGIGLVARPNAEAFSHAIEALWKDEDKRKKLGMKAKKYVQKHLTWDIYATGIEKILRQYAR